MISAVLLLLEHFVLTEADRVDRAEIVAEQVVAAVMAEDSVVAAVAGTHDLISQNSPITKKRASRSHA
jgi:hypothetical protein